MAAIADEIVAAKPAAVGLQEVTEWTTYPYDPTTGDVGDPTVVYDFLGLLMEALEARGADYRVVEGATAENFTSSPSRCCRAGRSRPRRSGSSTGTWSSCATTSGPPTPRTAASRRSSGRRRSRWRSTAAGARPTCGPSERRSASSTATPRRSARRRSASARSPSCSPPRPRSPPSTARCHRLRRRLQLRRPRRRDPRRGGVPAAREPAHRLLGGRERAAGGDTCCQEDLLTNPISQLVQPDRPGDDDTGRHDDPRRGGRRRARRPAGRRRWASDHAGVVARLVTPSPSRISSRGAVRREPRRSAVGAPAGRAMSGAVTAGEAGGLAAVAQGTG